MKENFSRGCYGQILQPNVEQKALEKYQQAMKLVEKAKKVAGWETGASFDNKGRGTAVNLDLYAIGKDYHSKKMLVIVQVREWRKESKNGFARIRKNWFLIGRNEDKTTFAHCIESRVIHAAIRKGTCPILACQDWIFGADYKKVLRQGDIALVPVKRLPREYTEIQGKVTFRESHEIAAEKIVHYGNEYYAINPVLTHTKQQHPLLVGLGTFRITGGLSKSAWRFANPTLD